MGHYQTLRVIPPVCSRQYRYKASTALEFSLCSIISYRTKPSAPVFHFPTAEVARGGKFSRVVGNHSALVPRCTCRCL